MYSEQHKLCELLLLTCNACLIFLARLPALLSVIKNLGRICKSCGQYFGHFDHSDWHVLDGWLARLKCVWLESVKEQYWTSGRNARQVQGSFLVNSKYWHLNSRYHQSHLCWKISTLYSLLSKSHKKSLHTVYTLYPYAWLQSQAHNMPVWRGSRLIDFTSGEVFSIVCAAQYHFQQMASGST